MTCTKELVIKIYICKPGIHRMVSICWDDHWWEKGTNSLKTHVSYTFLLRTKGVFHSMKSAYTSPLLLKVHLKTWAVTACSSLRLRRGAGFSFKAFLLSPESSEVAWKWAGFVGCVGDPKVFIIFAATKVSMTDNFYLSCPNGLTHSFLWYSWSKWQPEGRPMPWVTLTQHPHQVRNGKKMGSGVRSGKELSHTQQQKRPCGHCPSS